ncbi:Tubulin binding cofactor A [Giardia muris]|uniref:Tubulin-specific chaperone A n=1 Tax=Giardia muris TaxID=5742 RepID=A0A4Z1SXV3_GIAMU|nr:Tubulin binding cofactor A [Giardia muris]|eukprot:TNJ26513.1 Tubulin binding cofactor A [Giardia muris]
MTDPIKELTKQEGITRRMTRDLYADVKEIQTEKDRLAKMEAQGAEEPRINIQRQVLKEAEDGILDTLARLSKQIKIFEKTIKEIESKPIEAETQLEKAHATLAEAQRMYEEHKK